MTKHRNGTLDARDERLLALLRDDARAPVSALAEAAHLSATAVRRRLQRLEDLGAIAGYTLKASPRVGSPVRAVLEVRLAGARCPELVAALEPCPEVRSVLSVAGDVDTLVMLEAASPDAIGALADRVARLGFVERVSTRMVLATLLER